MKKKKDIRLLQKAEYYSTTEYPQFVKYAIDQQHSNWLHTDPSVQGDLHSILIDLSEAERHAVVSVLKLFVQYELTIGTTFWSAIGNTMPRSEVFRMCSTFSSMEIAVHAPFYAEVNRLLSQDTKEFYLKYKENPILVERMEFVNDHCVLGKKASVMDILLTLATFSFIEGVVLYSSFALLKSFQANGHNLIPNIVTGVDYVVRDESLHQQATAALYNTLLEEAELTNDELNELNDRVIIIAKAVCSHEDEISKIIFEDGKLSSISEKQINNFVKSRVDLCLSYLNIKPIYKIKYNPVADWFYSNINSLTLVDFFARNSTSYTRDWNEEALSWKNEREIKQ